MAPLFSAAALAQKVSYDHRPGENFARLKTYAFRSGPAEQSATAQATTYDSELMDERIQSAVARELELRGLKLDVDNPDAYVTLRRNFRTDYIVYPPACCGYGWPYYNYGWGPYYGYVWNGGPVWYDGYTVERLMGVLTIDVVDASTGALLWRGTGEKHVHESAKPSRRIERINDQVSDIMKRFPR